METNHFKAEPQKINEGSYNTSVADAEGRLVSFVIEMMELSLLWNKSLVISDRRDFHKFLLAIVSDGTD